MSNSSFQTTGTATISGTTATNMTLAGSLTLGTATMTANYHAFVNAAATAPEWGVGIKVGTFTRDLSAAGAPTDVAYAGAGFKPSAVYFVYGLDSYTLGSGFDNATVHYSMNHIYSGAVLGSGSFSIFINTASNTVQTAIVKSFDTDGFTLTWTKTGSPTGTANIYYMALR